MQEARAFGLALRLAYTMTGGAPGLLSHTLLADSDNAVSLSVPDEAALFVGDTVQRRLDAFGRALGRRAQLTRARSRQAARA
jgi:exopolyphosphatase/guanosine-5'-triphosphate,3'-diphosphate pyrophosphatase